MFSTNHLVSKKPTSPCDVTFDTKRLIKNTSFIYRLVREIPACNAFSFSHSARLSRGERSTNQGGSEEIAHMARASSPRRTYASDQIESETMGLLFPLTLIIVFLGERALRRLGGADAPVRHLALQRVITPPTPGLQFARRETAVHLSIP